MIRIIILFVVFIISRFVLVAQDNTDIKTLESDNLSDWLSFYNINHDDFKLDYLDANIIQSDSGSIYNWEFGNDQICVDSVIYTYSPNKRKYFNLLVSSGVFLEDSQYHFGGGDDSQGIYLTDLDNKVNYLLLYTGIGNLIEHGFWLNNNLIVLVSTNYYAKTATIHTFEVLGENIEYKRYTTLVTCEECFERSYFSKILKAKGIIED